MRPAPGPSWPTAPTHHRWSAGSADPGCSTSPSCWTKPPDGVAVLAGVVVPDTVDVTVAVPETVAVLSGVAVPVVCAAAALRRRAHREVSGGRASARVQRLGGLALPVAVLKTARV